MIFLVYFVVFFGFVFQYISCFFIIFHDFLWASGAPMGLRGPWASGPIGPMGRGSLGAHSGAQGSQGGIPGIPGGDPSGPTRLI